MSGHNKWSQIKLKKGKTDAKRSQIFARFAKLITNEARASKGKDSPSLRTAIERARKENMPNENIERAIKKATEAGGVMLESITYEAYGPGGVALMIDVLTDSRNRVVAEVKHILSEAGCALAGQGSASWAFTKTADGWVPTTMSPIEDVDLESLEKLIEALENNDDVQGVFTNAE